MSHDRRVVAQDLFEFSFPSRPAIEPGGDRIAFVVRRADSERNRYNAHIWIARPGSEPSRLTASGSDTDPLWLADGRLLFRSEREAPGAADRTPGSVTWYRINPDGGEAEEWFTVPRPVRWIRQIDANRFALLTWDDPASREQPAEHETRVHVFNRAPIWSNGEGFTHDGVARLSILNAETGELTDCSPPDLICTAAALSPDARFVVVTAVRLEQLVRPENRLVRIDPESGTAFDLTERLGLPVGSYSLPALLDAATLRFGFADTAEHGLNTSPQIYEAAADGSTIAHALTDVDELRLGVRSVGSDVRLGTPPSPAVVDGDDYFLVATQRYDTHLYALDRSGALRRVTDQSGSVDAFDCRDGRIAFVAMRDGRLPELFVLGDDGERRLTSFNDAWLDAHDIAQPLHMSVASQDDAVPEIDAWVLLPTGVDESTPAGSLPAILNIHGGPRTAYGELFFHEMQVWVAAGFAVVFANPRGSDGRGDRFADIRGRYGSVDYDDLMRALDEALRRYPVIDPERLCVTGGSYGGFMTNWMIGHTSRFRAAASQRSISNWIAFWGTSDIGFYFGDDQTGTTPWADASELWRQSPLAYADRVTTPTLFIHSDADHRCWIQDAIQMHTALCYHGVRSRLVWIEGENHELSRGGKPLPRVRRLTELADWFREHAGGDSAAIDR